MQSRLTYPYARAAGRLVGRGRVRGRRMIAIVVVAIAIVVVGSMIAIAIVVVDMIVKRRSTRQWRARRQ